MPILKMTLDFKLTMRSLRLRRKHANGFSLVELLVTLSIVGVLAFIALPAFTSILGDSALVSTTNEMVGSIHLARSEAVKRGVRAGVCPTADPAAANPVCSGTSAWTKGWLIFVDEDGNGVRDLPADEALSVKEARSGGFVFTPDAQFTSLIYFDTDGSSISKTGLPLSGNLLIKFGDGEKRNIQISANGRVTTTTP